MSRAVDALLRPSLLALAIGLSTPLASPALFAAEQSALHSYDLPSAPLASTLNHIASQAGVTLALDPALASGRTSAPVQGQYNAVGALQAALRGTGLQLQQSSAGSYSLVLVEENAIALPTTDINATLANADGSAASGYRAETVRNVGALGAMTLQDTPYSMSVASQDYLKNTLTTSLDDVFKRNPATQISSPRAAGYASAVAIRGFSGSGNMNIANDGLRFSNGADAGNFIEDTEQLEIITGLTGFLYGPATPGGLVNYVLKRPTYQRYNSVTLGNAGGENYYLHGDFGGKIDDAGVFAYRLNLLTQDGETAIDLQKRRRQMISAALDWNVSDDLQIQFDASHRKTQMRGLSSYWYVPAGIERPDASSLKNDKLYSQKWSFSDNETDKAGVRANWRMNDTFTLRAAVAAQQYTDEYTYTGPTLTSATTYSQPIYAFAPMQTKEQSASLFLDAAFSTGSLGHKLTLGYQGNTSRIKKYDDNFPTDWQYQSPVGTLPIGEQPQVDKPDWSIGHGNKRLASTATNHNFLLGDIITINEQWSTILGVTQTQIKSYSNDFIYSNPEKKTRYDKSKTSPNVSIIYKPVPWLTTYATYIEGLQSGSTAPSNTVNAGQAMAPQVSEQYEIGVKATVGETLFTLALFNIDKPNNYTNGQRVYVQDGRQENNGMEFSVTGKLAPELTVVGGITVLDPKIKKGATAANDGNAPVNVAKQMAKVYAEYDINAIPGLALTGGAYYTGKQYADEANTVSLPSFTTFDAGARYKIHLADANDVTLRLNVANLADKAYWLNSSYLGDPRTVQFSAQLEF